MLTIIIEALESYNEDTNEFIIQPSTELRLEHSLVSIAKWESKWKKVFLDRLGSDDPEKRINEEQLLDYIRCMTIGQNVKDDIYNRLSKDNIRDILSYMDDRQSAIKVPTRGSSNEPSDALSSDIIYYYMCKFNIPFETQKWHINRLLTLINVFAHKEAPKKKRSTKELAEEQIRINEENKKRYNTGG